jgi:diguanylate cyclase (GGDEF)-like protein
MADEFTSPVAPDIAPTPEAPAAAPSWHDVMSSQEFQRADPKSREAARNLYFDEIVKPRVSPEQLPDVRKLFDADTANISDHGDFTRGLVTAFQQVPQLTYGVAALGAASLESALGSGGLATAAKKWAVEGYQRWGDTMQANARDTDSFSAAYDRAKAGEYGALVDWVQYALGYTVGQGAQMLATGGAGSVAGKAVLKGAAEKFVGGMVSREATTLGIEKTADVAAREAIQKAAVANVAGRLGQMGAIGASAYGQEAGEIGGDLTSENKDRELSGAELGRAFGSIAVAGSLEFAADKLGYDTVLGKNKWGAGGITGIKGRAARAAVGTAVNAPAEFGTEYAQTQAEEYGKGHGAFTPEANKQALDAGMLGAVGGGVHGVVGGAFSSPEAASKLDQAAAAAVVTAPDLDTAIAAAERATSAPLALPAPTMLVTPEGEAATEAQRADVDNVELGAEPTLALPAPEPRLALPAPGPITVRPEGFAATQVELTNATAGGRDRAAQIRAERERLGMTPDIERVVAADKKRSFLNKQYRDDAQAAFAVAENSGKKPGQFLRLIAAHGGISREDAAAQGIDPAHFSDTLSRQVFGQPLFPKTGGMTFDEAAEFASQFGYGSKQYSANEFLATLDDALRGKDVRSQNEHYEDLNARMEAERSQYYEDREHAPESLGIHVTPTELAVSGYTKADPKTKDLSALFAVAREQMGSDEFDALLERVASQNENATDDQFEGIIRAEIERHGKAQTETTAARAAGGENIAAPRAVVATAQGEARPAEAVSREQRNPISEVASPAGSNGSQDDSNDGGRGNEGTYRGRAQNDGRVDKGSSNTASEKLTPVSQRGQADLFGGATPTQQAVHEADLARTRAIEAAPPIESGPGDLFTGANPQTDIEDVTKRPERRHDVAQRKRVTDMSPEELQRELLTDPLTGLPNRRAYDEAAKKSVQIAIDADSLKWVNDNLGHDAGDKMLAALGQGLRESGAEAYHISGDEFVVQGDDQAALERALSEITQRLERAELVAETPDGATITKTGVHFSYGIGATRNEADQALNRAKSEREAKGVRAARGEEPPGVARVAARQQTEVHPPAAAQEVTAKQTPSEDGVSASAPKRSLAEMVDEAIGGRVISDADKLRRQADAIMKEALKMQERIPAGQPIHSTRDRNYRDKIQDKMRKAADLTRQADALDNDQRPSTIDEAAAEAATSPDNNLPEPTEAQKEAGNYKLGHVSINGMDISIENPAGSKRRPEWKALAHHYGYFKGTIGKDKDHIDVFLSDRADDASLPVFVVDQVNKDGKFDEHKVMLGFPDEDAARSGYLANYEDGWTGLGAIKRFTLPEFKLWLRAGNTKKPVALSDARLTPVSKRAAPVDKSDERLIPASKRAETTTVLAAHDDFLDRLEKGELSVDEFKKHFEEVVASESAITTELKSLTKEQLLKRGGSMFAYRYKNDAKPKIVDALYGNMLSDFAFDSVSFSIGSDYKTSYLNAVRRQVDAVTADSLAEYAKKVQAAIAERKQQVAGMMEAVKDPKTLEDFQTYLRFKKRDTLTPEQRERFDELSGEKSRSERLAQKARERTTVTAAGATTGAEIIETKHTRAGYDLFVVKPAERVEREVYNSWNATAKKLGGWYSSFRGNGAVPGFQFKTREAAQAFQKYVSGGDTEAVKEQAQARRDAFEDDRSQSAVERLREMAGSLDERADESLGRDRKANTERRARMAASAEAEANYQKSMAATMRNIAQAIEDGKAKFLDRVRQKSQVEMLNGFVTSAKYKQLREKYKDYSDYEKHQHDKPTSETAGHAEFPEYTAYRSDLANLGRQVLNVDGLKQIGQRLLKVADDVTDAYTKFAKESLHKVSRFSTKSGERPVYPTKDDAETAIIRSGYNGKATSVQMKRGQHMIVLSPSEARREGIWDGDDDKRITLSDEFGTEIVDKVARLHRRGNVSVPHHFDTTREQRKRLASMGIETPAEFRSALREFIRYREAPPAPDKVKEMERAMIGQRKDGLDFFPTPANVANDMIQAADIKEGMSILEPSAGMGHIAGQIREAGFQPDVIELSGDRRELLEAKGYNVVGRDFMDYSGDKYDRIIMNPPFSDRRDMQHVQHAYDLLKPGGRLVAIVGEGVFFGSDKKATAFRSWLESVGGSDEKLEEGSFQDASLPVNTGTNARMVVIDKPDATSADEVKFSLNKTESAVNKLNELLAKQNGEAWRNAYVRSELDKSQSRLAQAFKAAFGTDIVGIKPTDKRFADVGAMHVGGVTYINTEFKEHGFVQLAGHELLHQIRRERPNIYDWFAANAQNYLKKGAEESYRSRLEKAGADMRSTDVREEILADFVGDSLADREFLDHLASRNKTKFRMLVDYVVKWLNKTVAQKLKMAGFGSSQYFTDVRGLQGYLSGVLDAYRSDAATGSESVKFSRASGKKARLRRHASSATPAATTPRLNVKRWRAPGRP